MKIMGIDINTDCVKITRMNKGYDGKYCVRELYNTPINIQDSLHDIVKKAEYTKDIISRTFLSASFSFCHDDIIVSISNGIEIRQIKHTTVECNQQGISKYDIERLMKEVLQKHKNKVAHHKLIQILPFAFKVDGGDELKDPLGMRAASLEVSANIIYAKRVELDFAKSLLREFDQKIDRFVYSEYAKMLASLKSKEIPIEKKLQKDYACALGACLYEYGFNALYEVDSNGDVLLSGF